MSSPSGISRSRLLWFATFLLLIALFLRLDHNPLRGEEPRRALVSLEMDLSSDFVSPSINGMNYYNKLPGYNWFHVGLFRIIGSHEEWVMRLPGVLALLLTGVLLFLLVRKYLDDEIAVMSAFFYMTSVDILFYFSLLGEIDLFYSLVVFLQIASLLHFSRKDQWWAAYLLSYFFATFGLMTKGLPSPVFQILTLLALALTQRSVKFIFRWSHLAGILLAVSLFSGYIYLYSQNNPEQVLLVKILTESSERTLFEHGLIDGIWNMLSLPLIFLKILLPWALFLLFCLNRAWWKDLKTIPILRFVLFFVVVNAIPYMLSPGLKERYLYPFLPFMTIPIAYGYTHYHHLFPLRKKIIRIVASIAASILLVVFITLPWIDLSRHIPAVWLISIMGALSSIGLGWSILFKKINLFWSLLFVVLMVRLGIDLALIPIQKQEMDKRVYEIAAREIIDQTGKDKIWLTGPTEDAWASFEIGSRLLISQKYELPAKLPWDLSYYLSRSNRHIVEYTSEILPDRYYISNIEHSFSLPADTLYSFTDPKYHNTYLVLHTR